MLTAYDNTRYLSNIWKAALKTVPCSNTNRSIAKDEFESSATDSPLLRLLNIIKNQRILILQCESVIPP